MKTVTKLLVVMAALCCSIGSAQIGLIYSNSFVWGGNGSVSVYQTPPTYATNFLGASSSAVWLCTVTNPDPTVTGSGTLYQNGTIGTNQGCALLPLTVQTNTVYILQASVNLPSPMASDVEIGFTVTNTSQYNFTNYGFARFNDTPPTGYAWNFMKVGAGTTFFGGPKTSLSDSGGPGGVMLSAGTHNLEIILNTLNNTNAFSITNAVGHGATNYWMASSYIDGLQVGTNIFYVNTPGSPAPLSFRYCGLGQATFVNDSVQGIQWSYFTVSTPLLPMITQQPVSTNAVSGFAFTNTVVALVDTNGGALFYQWYTNNVPIGGATNATLIINPISPINAGTNYYVVITNTYGAVTSAVASLTVYTSPVFQSQLPATYTNLFTLYAGVNPTFSVLAAGAQPIYYYWFTNSVLDAAATSTNLAFANVQIGNFSDYCIASNFLGEATSMVWSAQVIADPVGAGDTGLAPYPQAVLALKPIGYWRMNDTNLDGVDGNDVGSLGSGNGDVGDGGYICHDYVGGNDGIYTNVTLNNPGYNPATDPSDSSAQFGSDPDSSTDFGDSDANSIAGINFGAPGGSNVAFTVEAWVSGYPQTSDAGIVTLGWGGGGEQFDLDTGADGGNPSHAFRFLIRDASGTAHIITSSIVPSAHSNNFGPWYHLVGVVDEITNDDMAFYINGQLVGTTAIASGSGLLASSYLMSIGARPSSSVSTYDDQFLGDINDVAIFNYALSAGQVVNEYEAGGGVVVPYFLSPLPPTNVLLTVTNTTLTIPATALGALPIGYYWTNLNTSMLIGSGTTNAQAALNATLTLTGVTTNMDGQVLELVVTNAVGSTNWFVTLSLPAFAPTPQTISYTNSILYSNSFVGGSSTIGGTAATLVNSLMGGTNTTWICTYTNGVGISNGTIYANGTIGTNPGCALVPFTPESGYIYTMTASLTEPSSMANWVAMGFTQLATQTNDANGDYCRFTDNPPNGYGWMYVENASAVYEVGPRTTGSSASIGGLSTSFPVTNLLQIILITTNSAWTESASLNGVGIYTNTYNPNPPIAYAGLCENQFAGTEQWNYWTLTQVAPGGVPPYLYTPLPPTNIVLQPNMTLTIPVTTFGTAPLGYYWSNLTTATVIGAGATNNMSPLNATLTVLNVPVSWGGDQLELTVTNAYGTNITLFSLSSVTAPGFQITFTNNDIYLTWPAQATGWELQAQTNARSVGISTNWVSIPNSVTTNEVVFPINLTNGSVFYRLIYP